MLVKCNKNDEYIYIRMYIHHNDIQKENTYARIAEHTYT